MFKVVMGGVAAVVLGICAAALVGGPPVKKEPAYRLDFVKAKRAAAPGGAPTVDTFDCYGRGHLETCLKNAGPAVCGPGEEFEIRKDVPLRYDVDGSPLLSYRCFVRVKPPAI